MTDRDEQLTATSFNSFEEAAIEAMGPQMANHEMFEIVSASVERGGFVGRPQFRVTLRRANSSS
jgi:hypothetical protein